jgi:dTDP-glucose 4,6-dehydratase
LVEKTIRLGNLDAKRDFTYVSDTVRGFLAAGSVIGVEGGVFNLGTGREIRIGDAADLIALKVGHKVDIVIDPTRLRPQKSEVLRLVSDNTRARTILGWSPEVSLEDGLDHSITWVRDNLKRYKPGTYEI